jgi:hypothetical protein
MIIDPRPARSTELRVLHVGSVSIVSIPEAIWTWYKTGHGSPLTEEEMELLFLHELGHARTGVRHPLLGILGTVTFVSAGYFRSAVDSRVEERGADRFAEEHFTRPRRESSPATCGLHTQIRDATRHYTASWSSLRRTAPAKRLFHIGAVASTIVNRSPLMFLFGQDSLGYIHPESDNA